MDAFWAQKMAEVILGAICGAMAGMIIYLAASKMNFSKNARQIMVIILCFLFFKLSYGSVIPRFLEWTQKRAMEKQESNPPVTVTAEDHSFSITFPAGLAAPKMESGFQDTPTGKVKTVSYSAGKSRMAGFVCSYFEYPDSVFNNRPENEILMGSGNGGLAAMGGTPTNTKMYDFKGHKALRIDFVGIEKKDPSFINQRFDGSFLLIISKPRIYQILGIFGEDTPVDHPELERFMDSMKF